MAFRTGMTDIEARLRRTVDDAGTAVWSRQALQDVLDTHRIRLYREILDAERTLTGTTTYEYTRFHSRWKDLEAGGTAYLQVEDSAGEQRGTADYTVDYIAGLVTMGADQAGTALYLTAWSYDLNGAAAQCWRERATKVTSYYDVRADGHTLSRSQWHEHCLTNAKEFAMQARISTVRQYVDGVFEYR